MKQLEVVNKRLDQIEKKERKWVENIIKNDKDVWYDKFVSKIPKIVVNNLQLAFNKAFELLFVSGTGIISKVCPKENYADEHNINDYAFNVKGTAKSLKKLSTPARNSQRANVAITTAEGLVMGITGAGIPDIPLFLTVLLRGIYEIAATFGIDYTKQNEKYFILLLMETVVLRGKEKLSANQKVDDFMNQLLADEVKPYNFKDQMVKTSNAYSTDMLLLKFVQGAPVVGLIGGLSNPVYYKRLSDYARIKYEKRYLLQKSIELKNA